MPGGGLGFLNKKYWHPARPQNLEIKWKKEQEAAAETKRLEELRKQLEEERQREELQNVAERAGIKKREARLDWMYQGGVAARQDAEKRAEEALLTGKIPDAPAEQHQGRADNVSLLPTFYAEDTPASANETWARLHNDPLFAIKQQEVAQRKQVLSNPMTMLQLKKQVSAVKGKDKKKDKKEKKEKKDKHRRDDSPRRMDDRHKRRQASPDDRDGKRARYNGRHEVNGHDKRHDDDERRHSHAADQRHDRSNGRRGSPAANGGGRTYGLDYGAHNPDKEVGYDTSALAAATRQRLEEAAKRKAREEKEAAAARGMRRTHQTGRLSEAEKAARLAEMVANAREHESHRTSRVGDATARERAEEEQERGRDSGKFLKDAAGALQAGSAADHIARRKHYINRDAGL